ncbi:hypothetical protein F4780DRAFT_225534 [Xylariomycetidae sp. FL0641]|nr:hypothetical protein F4780DRAFT_225534 [Xylariomycetidae sp. FL0641]
MTAFPASLAAGPPTRRASAPGLPLAWFTWGRRRRNEVKAARGARRLFCRAAAQRQSGHTSCRPATTVSRSCPTTPCCKGICRIWDHTGNPTQGPCRAGGGGVCMCSMEMGGGIANLAFPDLACPPTIPSITRTAHARLSTHTPGTWVVFAGENETENAAKEKFNQTTAVEMTG